MADLQKYVQAATSTESRVDSIVFNKADLSALLNIAIGIANILDAVKKRVFYNRSYDAAFLTTNHRLITNNLEALQRFVRNPEDSNRSEDQITDTRTAHGLLGIFTEAGELVEVLKTLNETGSVDVVNIGEELGDIDWYKAVLADANNLNLEDILATNIKKLEERYKKKKFEAEAANERDLVKERNILETTTQQSEFDKINSVDLDAKLDVTIQSGSDYVVPPDAESIISTFKS